MALTFVKDLEPWKAGQTRALYERDGEFLMISTVGEVAAEVDPASRAIIGIAGVLCGSATSGEETMAFSCDADGEVTNWTEIESANGSNSRATVLSALGWTEPAQITA